MDNIDYSYVTECPAIFNSKNTEIRLKQSDLTINIGLIKPQIYAQPLVRFRRKIKFALEIIYFFSLIYFTSILIT